MARFSYDEVDNYGGSGSGNFLSIPNDGDVVKVRFMYNGLDDIEGFAIHQVEIDGKRKYVNCLREYGKPVDDCPLCKSGSFVNAKLFIPVYDVESGTVKIWERGKKFFGKIAGLCSRYASKDPLVSHIFEIERHGKKGDTQTTYEVYECGADETILEDLPEVPTILGSTVLDKSKDELQYYVDYGEFPGAESSNERPARRSTSSDDMPVRRRTPRSNEDTF